MNKCKLCGWECGETHTYRNGRVDDGYYALLTHVRSKHYKEWYALKKALHRFDVDHSLEITSLLNQTGGWGTTQ